MCSYKRKGWGERKSGKVIMAVPEKSKSGKVIMTVPRSFI